ncbi:MAG TPA: CsbD family protein [Actinomycetota bacterium]|jgi:uncharacterized protein YjbJ (UPF0337 family)
MGATKDKAEGAADRAKGKVKEGAGRLTGDRDTEAEGKADQLKGSGKQAVGHAKDAARKVKEGVKDAFDRD